MSSANATLLAQTFASDFTLDELGGYSFSFTPSNSYIPNIVIYSTFVISPFSEVNTKKNYGSDAVPPMVLKTFASDLSTLVNYSLCLSISTFRSFWKYALL